MNKLKIALITASVLKNIEYEENVKEIIILTDVLKNE